MEKPWTDSQGVMFKKIQHPLFSGFINRININILVHGHLQSGNCWRFGDSEAPFNRLYLVFGGDGFIEISGKKTLLTPGYIYLLPAGSSCQGACKTFIEKFYIHFRFEVYPGKDLFSEHKSLRFCAMKNIAKTRKILERAGKNTAADLLAVKAFLLETLIPFARIPLDSLARSMHIAEKYQALFTILETGRFADFSAGEIARLLGMSVSGLTKSFKKDTGISMRDYYRQKIITQARELLVLGNSHVKEIARSLSFNDEFYFSRFFKKAAGISPLEYRKNNKL